MLMIMICRIKREHGVRTDMSKLLSFGYLDEIKSSGKCGNNQGRLTYTSNLNAPFGVDSRLPPVALKSNGPDAGGTSPM